MTSNPPVAENPASDATANNYNTKSAQDIGRDLAACYLSSSIFTVGGVVLGTVAAARAKNIKFLAVGAFFGTTFDAVYG
jgi:hypothetical protein